jgi:hypothetical protein
MSRFTEQAKSRTRAYNKRLANQSMTERERKFYQRKMGESVEHHIQRMLDEAKKEQSKPTEWWRRLARVLTAIQPPYSMEEYKLIRSFFPTDTPDTVFFPTIAAVERKIIERRKKKQDKPSFQQWQVEQLLLKLRYKKLHNKNSSYRSYGNGTITIITYKDSNNIHITSQRGRHRVQRQVTFKELLTIVA